MMKTKGWAIDIIRNERVRFKLLGQRRYYDETRNKWVCDICGEHNVDKNMLKRHKASPFCRVLETEEELVARRIARNAEEKRRLLGQEKLEKVEVFDAEGTRIPVASRFKYLGTVLAYLGEMTLEVKKRTEEALAVVKSLHQVWRDRAVGDKLKRIFLMQLVLSIMLYNAETWVLEKEEVQKLKRTYYACLRRATASDRLELIVEENYDAISPKELRRQLSLPKMEDILSEKRLRWAATMLNAETESEARKTYEEEKRRNGAWYELLEKDMGGRGIQTEEELTNLFDKEKVKGTLDDIRML